MERVQNLQINKTGFSGKVIGHIRKNFRHLAGTKAKARWNASTADAPTATDNAKWDPRRVGYYRGRFQEETACLSRG